MSQNPTRRIDSELNFSVFLISPSPFNFPVFLFEITKRISFFWFVGFANANTKTFPRSFRWLRWKFYVTFWAYRFYWNFVWLNHFGIGLVCETWKFKEKVEKACDASTLIGTENNFPSLWFTFSACIFFEVSFDVADSQRDKHFRIFTLRHWINVRLRYALGSN